MLGKASNDTNITNVPSRNFRTARWSPKGDFIVAVEQTSLDGIFPIELKVCLFDFNRNTLTLTETPPLNISDLKVGAGINISPDGQMLAVTPKLSPIERPLVFNITDRHNIKQILLEPNAPDASTINNPYSTQSDNSVNNVVFSADHQYLIYSVYGNEDSILLGLSSQKERIFSYKLDTNLNKYIRTQALDQRFALNDALLTRAGNFIISAISTTKVFQKQSDGSFLQTDSNDEISQVGPPYTAHCHELEDGTILEDYGTRFVTYKLSDTGKIVDRKVNSLADNSNYLKDVFHNSALYLNDQKHLGFVNFTNEGIQIEDIAPFDNVDAALEICPIDESLLMSTASNIELFSIEKNTLTKLKTSMQ
ncbi:hypothetical protein [Acinetobacter nectaris]|uniref:hypothetical protein n=1 Tax=Acinetobacter nectaris TaxID=1219382 RepID=UPI001F2AFB9E|nr:hypothetical protein [Acinetobacter nectaris]MCF9046631.1 hypothetical protein [Acinetobacter nectaris]